MSKLECRALQALDWCMCVCVCARACACVCVHALFCYQGQRPIMVLDAVRRVKRGGYGLGAADVDLLLSHPWHRAATEGLLSSRADGLYGLRHLCVRGELEGSGERVTLTPTAYAPPPPWVAERVRGASPPSSGLRVGSTVPLLGGAPPPSAAGEADGPIPDVSANPPLVPYLVRGLTATV